MHKTQKTMAETINNNLFLQQNQLFVAGDLHVHTDKQNTQTKTENSEDILENRIFSKLFDTNQKLLRLRQEIANSVDLGEFAPLYTDTIALNRSKIDPQIKHEWFYILAALTDSHVLRNRPVKDREFIEQMILFFPILPNLNFETSEEYRIGMRQLTQSISVERRKWKINGEVVRLVDIMAKKRRFAQLSEEKIARIYRIAFPLYTALCQFATELKGL